MFSDTVRAPVVLVAQYLVNDELSRVSCSKLVVEFCYLNFTFNQLYRKKTEKIYCTKLCTHIAVLMWCRFIRNCSLNCTVKILRTGILNVTSGGTIPARQTAWLLFGWLDMHVNFSVKIDRNASYFWLIVRQHMGDFVSFIKKSLLQFWGYWTMGTSGLNRSLLY